MFIVLVWVILLSTTEVQSKYKYRREINGWITVHKVAATWDEALQQCESEGAILMSPIRKELLNALKENVWIIEHFIGTKIIPHTSIYVSVEGVPLHDMPVDHMISKLSSQDGACLKMVRDRINVESCNLELPYMCYKEEKKDLVLTECGTFDKAYKLNNSTGSCYKFHAIESTWTQAYSTCVAEGGYLAIVNNYHEAQELVEISYSKEYYVLIGLRDWKGDGDWKSVHGDHIQQIHNVWEDSVFPVNMCCDVGTINPNTGLLKSLAQNLKGFFICEKDPNYIKFPSYEELV